MSGNDWMHLFAMLRRMGRATRSHFESAAFKPHLAIRLLGDTVIVRDHDDGLPCRVKLAEDFEDLLPGFDIEIAGGFISQKHIGLIDEGTGDGDALAFAA